MVQYYDAMPLSFCSMALCVQVYLKMDRVDKAEQQLKVRYTEAESLTPWSFQGLT